MANSFTTNLNLTKPEVGADTNLWGGHLNTDFDQLDGIFTSASTTVVSMVISQNTKFVGTTTTRVMKLNLDAVSTTATRTLSVQDASGTVALVETLPGVTTASGFLGADLPVAAGNSFQTAVTITPGVAGTYLVNAGMTYSNGSGGGMTVVARITNPAGELVNGSASIATGFFANIALAAIGTVTVGGGFSLSGTDNIGSNNGTIKTTGSTGSAANKATWATCVRIF